MPEVQITNRFQVYLFATHIPKNNSLIVNKHYEARKPKESIRAYLMD